MNFATAPADFFASPLALPIAACLAVVVDRLLGEARRWHPLVGFGHLAGWLEGCLNRACCRAAPGTPRLPGNLLGLLAWLLAVAPWVALAWAGLHLAPPPLAFAGQVALLYFAIGARSLGEHAQAIAAPLAAGDLAEARRRVGWIVSRDTSVLDESGVAKAAVESLLENGNDAVFGALFWFALLGGPGALLFRLANTLDAMWGYRTERLRHFGWAAARIDDALNWLPARLTALSYALFGRTRLALACWRRQAPTWDSPNAGPVMAAGAGSLGLALGGAAIYHGQREERPALGAGNSPAAADIPRAMALVRRSLGLWLAVLILIGASHA